MCGIVGFTNFNEKCSTSECRKIIGEMYEKIARRGPDEEGIFIKNNIAMGHKRLIVIDPDNGKQPMTYKYQGQDFTIVFNGQIYNSNEIRKVLEKNGFEFKGHSDTEVLLKAYMHYGYEVCEHINGIFAFAIWNETKKELFLARDHMGVKPLFYSIKNKEIIFASEIKALFEYPSIYPKISRLGISEMFALGPAHTPGVTAFEEIEELRPAHYMIVKKDSICKSRYWKLQNKVHKDSFEETCYNVKSLLENSIESQLISDVPICTFLSGGLDSSIISLYAANYYKKHNLGRLNTFSVDYKDNDKNFKKTDFQPNTDKDYIEIMKNKLDTNHETITLDTPELAEYLKDAMIARDMPGMADVDSSLLLFCKKVKTKATVALTGECADELFAGYPWFFREDALKSNTFPWSINLEDRQRILNEKIGEKIDLKEYANYRYKESLSDIDEFDLDDEDTKQKKKTTYLTMNWFMQTLLDRSDRMAMYSGMELRVPFCDYRIAEYLFNIPWKLKAYNGREKGLLRYIMKEVLPREIVERKKSPYPKTWNPTYTNKVRSMLIDIMKKEDAPVKSLLNEKEILSIINRNNESAERPWFGQLMTTPQLMAYICQINMWLEEYKPLIIN